MEQDGKPKGIAHLIDIENPNRAKPTYVHFIFSSFSLSFLPSESAFIHFLIIAVFSLLQE